MTRRIVIGVMGAGEGADPADVATAFVLGQKIAAKGWVLLSGGRNVGVMDAAGSARNTINVLSSDVVIAWASVGPEHCRRSRSRSRQARPSCS